MEKGDWLLILIVVIILIVVALITTNMDKMFPTPEVREAIAQSINAT